MKVQESALTQLRVEHEARSLSCKSVNIHVRVAQQVHGAAF